MLLSETHQSEGIMISHGVRKTMRLLALNKRRCVILHINPPFQEVVVYKTFPKLAPFKDVVDALDYTTPAYLACWFHYEDKNQQSHTSLVFAFYNPVYAIGSKKDALLKQFPPVVEKLGLSKKAVILYLNNSDLEETLIIKRISNK